MDRGEEIQDILELRDELIRHRTIWDVKPWLGLDMSTPQFKALILIYEKDGVRMRELARRLGGSFSNATVLVDRLVERGLVERMAEPQDRRVVLVRVTEEGRCLVERLVTSWRALSPSLLKNLAPNEIAKVHDALCVLLKAARQNNR